MRLICSPDELQTMWLNLLTHYPSGKKISKCFAIKVKMSETLCVSVRIFGSWVTRPRCIVVRNGASALLLPLSFANRRNNSGNIFTVSEPVAWSFGSCSGFNDSSSAGFHCCRILSREEALRRSGDANWC